MAKTVFLFPGQGAQYVGMGKDLHEAFSVARETFEEANAALGFDLARICFEGPEERLQETEITQPAILTMSVAVSRILARHGIRPQAAAGLSLGEYAALVEAGVLGFSDAVRLVHRRGKYMQEAVPRGRGKMAAIIGLSAQDVVDLCRHVSEKTGSVLEAANFNCPGQTVVSGEAGAVKEAIKEALERGAAKAVPLAVSAPFHSRLMLPAGEKLARDLEKITFNSPAIRVVANVTADYILNGEVKDLLTLQVSKPVRWEETLRRLIDDGYDDFLEVGPGTTLSGFMKRVSRKVSMASVGDLPSLEKCLAKEREGCYNDFAREGGPGDGGFEGYRKGYGAGLG